MNKRKEEGRGIWRKLGHFRSSKVFVDLSRFVNQKREIGKRSREDQCQAVFKIMLPKSDYTKVETTSFGRGLSKLTRN